MQAVLEELGEAFPTSSVNQSGESACQEWSDAICWVKSREVAVYVPSMTVASGSVASRPSTLIRIIDSQQYEIVREGALEASFIAEVVKAHVRNI